MIVDQPPGVYKNLQRKFERVRVAGGMDVSFSLHGTKVELNFPKSDRFNPVEPPEESTAFDPKRIEEVVQTFRTRMESLVSDSKIVMMRDRMPRTWEEKIIVRLGKCSLDSLHRGGLSQPGPLPRREGHHEIGPDQAGGGGRRAGTRHHQQAREHPL